MFQLTYTNKLKASRAITALVFMGVLSLSGCGSDDPGDVARDRERALQVTAALAESGGGLGRVAVRLEPVGGLFLIPDGTTVRRHHLRESPFAAVESEVEENLAQAHPVLVLRRDEPDASHLSDLTGGQEPVALKPPGLVRLLQDFPAEVPTDRRLQDEQLDTLGRVGRNP